MSHTESAEKMFIDSHTHLDIERFDQDRDEVVERAREKGVKYILNIGTDIESSRKSLQIAHSHDTIFSAVGVHPNDAKSFNKSTKKSLLDLVKNEKTVAIGEIGLDYYRDYSPPEVQKEVFAEQLNIAKNSGMPVVIHVRDAWQDVENVINSTTNGDVKGVFHCFSADLETAKRLIKKGFYISFGGNITFKNYKHTEMLKEIQIEKMLIETDCPFLAPEPFRGRRNEPGYVPLVAQRLADIKGLSLEDVGRITAHNASRLFGIAPETDEVKIVYQIRDSLYINPTLRCTADCVFCARLIDPVVKGHNLNLKEEDEPTVDEAIRSIGDPSRYKEVVFCGYGEPTLRLDFIKGVGKWLKSRGSKVRLNTNGHGNLIHGRNIAPELTRVVDEISISLNTHTEDQYEKIMRTVYKFGSFEPMIEFIRNCVSAGIKVDISIVDIPGTDVEECSNLARELGADFRVRTYNEVG